MSFAPGTLVKARGREWVVLPESEDDFLVVRPLGGTIQETAGIHSVLESVTPATFSPPAQNDLGDFVSCRLLRDAVRFGFRSSAGPFRSFGRLAVQPRPYQLVPLLMALKLDPIRLLIADDVGIGKTIEACLVAREMLDRGEITRLCVLCPPHLAEQWQKELATKFNIAVELVLSSTARRLEKNLRSDQSIFDAHPFVVVSMDFIKADRRRHDFLRTCPDFVIVDEAHTCASSAEGRGAAHQRHELLAKLAEKPERHLVLVTATPHSGNEGAFRSLLTLLTPDFKNLPDDLSGPDKAIHRRRLAAHLVQRRRADLRHFLQRDTPFPERKDTEAHYELSPAYKALFERVLDYARETVTDASGGALHQRVRWWSALSLLRAMASSPAAAAATLTERSNVLEASDATSADELGRKSVLDVTEDLGDEASDVVPGADPEAEGDNPVRRRLLAFAREARKLCGDEDHKLTKLLPRLQALLSDGFKPIIFCRFIQTAEYVAAELRARLKKVEVTCITSQLPPEERAARIETLGSDDGGARILVCTDCLSEGINLQEKFDAVVHYDLSWNPTRHEQRDGRVDRFGQTNEKKEVRILTYYGTDNQIDGIVLDVLLRKHQTRDGVRCRSEAEPTTVQTGLFGGTEETPKAKAKKAKAPTRCGLVARWAAGRAALLEQDAAAPPGLIEALHAAAGQAALLGELAECQGASLSEPQLARLLEEALANGAETNPFIEAEGGPIRVRSLSEIDGPCDRLIWLGPGTEDTAGCRWSAGQLRELRSAGVLMDDGSKVLSSLRSAETRGYCQVKESFLAVVLPQDLEKRWHPLWLAVRGLLPKPEAEQPPVLEDLVMTGDATALAPFGFEHHDVVIEPPQKSRPLWNIPANLLSDHDTVSASELHDRLACPLKWTLHYPAKIRPGSMAELPDDHQLKGTFCHSIFERVFGGGGELPTLDAAVAQALAVFDERLPLDAATLAQPNKYLERQRLRSQIENATRIFVSTLASGGYRIVGIEVALAGNAFGKPLNGWIDCVAKRNNGEEAIIDFKYGGRSKYHALIAEGRAVQLATYAYGRSAAGGAFPAVAYLVLSDGLLFTPSGSAVHGTAQHACINAPAIQTVWQKFSDALEAAGNWLTSGAPVPARPLQDSSEWPAGATIVLKEETKADEVQEVCRYCDFTRICGLEETT